MSRKDQLKPGMVLGRDPYRVVLVRKCQGKDKWAVRMCDPIGMWQPRHQHIEFTVKSSYLSSLLAQEQT
jgi:hypothetical protein